MNKWKINNRKLKLECILASIYAMAEFLPLYMYLFAMHHHHIQE